MSTALSLDHPRLRFNSGYWDGRNDRERNKFPMWADRAACWRGVEQRHPFDAIYGQAYWIGRNDDSDTQTSDAAWKARPSLRKN